MNLQCQPEIEKKGKFLYHAESSVSSGRFTLYFPDRPVHFQSDTISAFVGSFQPYGTINARKMLVHIPTTVYYQVLIYIAELTAAI